MPHLVFLTQTQYEVLAAAADRLIPPSGDHPGAAALGAVDYIDRTLGAFTFSPPRIWAGGPFSGRFGGAAGFETFHELTAVEELAWRTRIIGSRGDPAREWNGPVRGWQEIYADGIEQLGADFAVTDVTTRDARLAAASHEFRALLYEHLCEGCYGPPEYGGNRELAAWRAIEWPGDVQPRGYTDEEVSGR
jgi:hypothetical protein